MSVERKITLLKEVDTIVADQIINNEKLIQFGKELESDKGNKELISKMEKLTKRNKELFNKSLELEKRMKQL